MDHKKRILCVEDLADHCSLIAMVLSDHDIVLAHTKDSALRTAAEEKFDLYLLDYYLPDGTGVDLYHSIRRFDAATPVIFITNSAAISNSDVISLGAEQLIEKHHITDQLPIAAFKALNKFGDAERV